MAGAQSQTAAGDVTGDLSATIVTGLQNRAISLAAPADGQVLAWDGGSNQWKPQTIAAGGGGGGASMAAQLGDFGAVRTAANTLQVGGSCSVSTPCNVRIGNLTYSFTQAASLTAAGTVSGTGAVYLYISSAGVLTAGYDFPAGDTLNCGNCTVQANVSTFPVDAIPLFSWPATWSGSPVAASFDTGSAVDRRAVLSTGKTIASGVGLVAVETAASTALALDSSVVGLRVAVPASAASSCDSGSWAADGSYLYICFQTNAWRRVAVASW
jgi:hypothetical protein